MKRVLNRPASEALPPCEWSDDDDDDATPRRKAAKANPERAPTRSVPRLQAVGLEQLSRAYNRIDDRKESVRILTVAIGGHSEIAARQGSGVCYMPALEDREDDPDLYDAGSDDPDDPFAGMAADALRGVFVRGVEDAGVADDVLDNLVKIGEPVNFVVVVDGGDGDVARLVAHAAVQKAERRLSEGAMHPSGAVFLEELKREMRLDSLGYAQQPTRPRLRDLLQRTKRAGSATAERTAVRGFIEKYISEL